MILAAADGGAGLAAIVTAMGGVTVSLVTVWLNSKKQAQATGENTGTISALTEQLASLSIQLSTLKAENAGLKVQLELLTKQTAINTAAVVSEPVIVEKPKKKKKKVK